MAESALDFIKGFVTQCREASLDDYKTAVVIRQSLESVGFLRGGDEDAGPKKADPLRSTIMWNTDFTNVPKPKAGGSMSDRLFPIMGLLYRPDDDIRKLRAAGQGLVVVGIPWSLIAPHESQARANHGQTLERLAERGGLGSCEAVAVLEDRRWHRMAHGEANATLVRILTERAA